MNYVALGIVMACKNEGRTLELEEKEKWCVDEVERLKAIVTGYVARKGLYRKNNQGMGG